MGGKLRLETPLLLPNPPPPKQEAAPQPLQAGARGLGRLCKVPVGGKGWGVAKSEKQRKAKAFIRVWAVLGEHCGKKGESPVGQEQPCGGIRSDRYKCVVHWADMGRLKVCGC